jgi:hypothetical protein
VVAGGLGALRGVHRLSALRHAQGEKNRLLIA